MSLLSSFPEVEIFFKNDRFSQEELLSFIKNIENKYSDKQSRKAVSTLIQLKILEYTICDKEENDNKNAVEKYISISLNQSHDQESLLLAQALKNFSIENIAKNVEWQTSRLIRLLEQKDIVKLPNELLTEKEFELIKEMLHRRLLSLKRLNKKENQITIIRTPQKSHAKQIDVYDKIKKIGIGKIIYIRKK
jgi:hypothetical protein